MESELFNVCADIVKSKIKLSGNNSKAILTRLLYSEFHSYPVNPLPHEIGLMEELIETAIDYGLYELAEELKKDLR